MFFIVTKKRANHTDGYVVAVSRIYKFIYKTLSKKRTFNLLYFQIFRVENN